MKNTNESGRSMVEMLGVLAIIGVLSIGGIAGYTMAMNKYQANNIVNTIVQAAIACRTSGVIPADVQSAEEMLTFGSAASGSTPASTGCTKSTGQVDFTISGTGNNATAIMKQVEKTLNITLTNGKGSWTPAS